MFRRAIVCTTAAGVAALAACSGSSTPTGITAVSQVLPLAGFVVLGAPNFKDGTTGSSTATGTMSPGDPCTGSGGYSAVAENLTVAVTGADGQNLANLPLGSGAVSDSANGTVSCTFTFAGSVKSGSATYTVTVGPFMSKTFTLSQLGSITIDLPG